MTDQHIDTMLMQALAAYRSGDLTTAETIYGAVLLADPGNEHALHCSGLIARDRGEWELASRLLARAVAIHPHSPAANNLGITLAEMGEHDAAIATYRQAIALEPDYAEAGANLLFTLDLHPYATPELLKAERQAFDERCYAALTRQATPHLNDPDPDRRLRVGYVSADFRHHSAAMSYRNVICGHSEDVEVYLYSTSEKHDAESEPFKARADVWCEVADLDPAELASVIREDRVDVLVDLSGFSKGGRLLTFAHKPAPIQVSGWGYSPGTGISAIDYLIADDVTVPRELEHQYRERIMRLPCVFSYHPGDTYPDVGPSPQEKNGYRTYGYLGRAMKLNAPTLACWAQIMRRDPTGRLLIKGAGYDVRAVRDRIGRALLALGVGMDRVDVRGATSRREHLAAYREIDVALDPFPQSGGMTVCDSALMGVPTVTLLGEMIQGRQTASVMECIGYDEWVARSVDEYVWIATQRVPDLRSEVRGSLLDSPICNETRYPLAAEDAYRAAWRRWCSERQPSIVRTAGGQIVEYAGIPVEVRVPIAGPSVLGFEEPA